MAHKNLLKLPLILVLSLIIESVTIRSAQATSFIPELFPAIGRTNKVLSRNGLFLTDLEEALKDPKLRKATRELGQTRIDLQSLPFSSPILDSGMVAWSSWWFPKVDTDFVNSKDAFRPSILSKYDKFFNITDKNKSALNWEKEAESRLSHSSWEGLCDAWAIASIMHPEPQKPVQVEIKTQRETQNLLLSVFDLKGLLVKTYEAISEDQFEFYGEKFTASVNGWIHPDLFPDQFHRIVEIYLGEQKKAFVMDRDPGVEVWSVPVYKANYKLEAIPSRPNAVLVKMWLYSAGPVNGDEKDFVGTKEVIREYHYILSGDLDRTGRYLNVTRGEWLKTERTDSRVNHPDFIFIPKSKKIKRSTYNPNLDIQKVDQIIKRSLNSQ